MHDTSLSSRPHPEWFNLNPVDPAIAIREVETLGFVAYDRDCPAVPFSLPFDWLTDPFRDRNWRMQLHGWRMLDGYMRAFGDPDMAHQSLTVCVAVIDDWTRSTVAEQRNNDFTWYDLAVANRVLKLACLAITARYLGVPWPITPLRRAMIERHVAELRDPAKLTQGNHGFYQLHGLMALNWVFPDIATDELCHDYAASQLTHLLQFQFSESGVHLEDAPWYHFFSANACRKIVSSPWWAGHVAPEAECLLIKAEVAKSWLVAPDRKCVPIGDSPDAFLSDDVDHLLERPHQRQGRFVGSRLDGYGIVRSLPDRPPKPRPIC